MYTCISGMHPQPANDREKKDQLTPLHEIVKSGYSPELLSIVQWCLEIDHMKRPQTAFELQKALTQEPADFAPADIPDSEQSFTGRLKQTLNRKIF